MRLVLFLVTFLFLPAFSNACSCYSLPFCQEEFNNLDLIFTGRVDTNYYDTIFKMDVSKIKVIEWFKGDNKNEFIYTYSLGGSCHINIKQGDHFIFFLYGQGSTYSIDYCSRRIPIENIRLYNTPTWLVKYCNRSDGPLKDYDEYKTLRAKGVMKNHLPQGQWTYYNFRGKLSEKGEYINGKKHGKWTSYHLNGRIRCIASFNHGQLHGLCQYFDDEGRKEETSFFVNGILEGSKTYFYPSGQPSLITYYNHNTDTASISYYENGSIHRSKNSKKEIQWHINGTKEREILYPNAHKTVTKQWDNNGVLFWHREYISGVEHLIYCTDNEGKPMIVNGNGFYSLNGQEGEYKDSLRTGIWKQTYNTGGRTEKYFVSGKEEGISREWNASGKLVYERTFKNGVPEGPAFYYYNNGKLQLERKMSGNENLLINAWDPEGNQMIKDGTGMYQYFNTDGTLEEYLPPTIYENGKPVKK